MSFTVLDAAGGAVVSIDEMEAGAARARKPDVLPAWMAHRVWPIGFVRAIDVARARGHRRRLRRLLAEARAVLRADASGRTDAAARLVQGLRDAYDEDVTVTLVEPGASASMTLLPDHASPSAARTHPAEAPLLWRSRPRGDPRAPRPPGCRAPTI